MSAAFLLIATRRSDLTDHTIAIRTTKEMADRDRRTLAVALAADHVRVLVKPVNLDGEAIAAIVRKWASEDKASNAPRSGLDDWPRSWRAIYLEAFHTSPTA